MSRPDTTAAERLHAWRVRGGWTLAELVALPVLVAAGLLATRDAWQDIALLATHSEEQSHILLVPPITLWLAWIRRSRLRHHVRTARWVGPAFVALGWALYSGGDFLLAQSAWHLGAVFVVVGCLLSFWGGSALKRLLPAFAVLLFLVPVPGFIRQSVALPLQEITAEATRKVLVILGVDAWRGGSALELGGTTVLIAEACNGLRMVFALVLVSYTFAYTSPIRNPIRILILALSPVTAIACNVIRLVPTVWVHAFVSHEAGERHHDIGGWLMLPIAFLLLLGVFRLLRWAAVPVYRYSLAYGR